MGLHHKNLTKDKGGSEKSENRKKYQKNQKQIKKKKKKSNKKKIKKKKKKKKKKQKKAQRRIFMKELLKLSLRTRELTLGKKRRELFHTRVPQISAI